MPQEPDTTQPVPKEGVSIPPQPSETPGQPTTNIAGPSSDVSQQAPSQPTVPTQPSKQPTAPQPPREKVIIKEKGGNGMCNTTTCCIGSCVGCLFIILVLVILGIFAAPTLSNLLNKVINPGVNIPEVTEVEIKDLSDTLKDIPSSTQQQTLKISENEFNVLLKEKYENAPEGELKLDIRADFEEDLAKVYIKLTTWMPWAIIEIASDENGNLSTTSVKLGPLDVSNYVTETVQREIEEREGEGFSADTLDFTSLFESLLFEDDADKVAIQAIYFNKDEVEITVVPSALEQEDSFESESPE